MHFFEEEIAENVSNGEGVIMKVKNREWREKWKGSENKNEMNFKIQSSFYKFFLANSDKIDCHVMCGIVRSVYAERLGHMQSENALNKEVRRKYGTVSKWKGECANEL